MVIEVDVSTFFHGPEKSEQLFNAIKDGNLQRVAELLNDPTVDILYKDHDLNTAYHIAADRVRAVVLRS